MLRKLFFAIECSWQLYATPCVPWSLVVDDKVDKYMRFKITHV